MGLYNLMQEMREKSITESSFFFNGEAQPDVVYNSLKAGGLVSKPEIGEATLLLQSWSRGDKTALDQLMPLVYRELRRLAANYLRRERGDHTLQTTALVHEAYLKLVDQTRVDIHSRSQFFGVAANLMRQILVNYAERHRAAKRGGGNKVALEEAVAIVGQPQVDILALDQALNKLAAVDPRQSRIVELRFFGGLTEAEVAEVVGVSQITVQREWRTARAVLHNELRHGDID
jgi:RNA polymerase sigma factor (TIGR02999 family)